MHRLSARMLFITLSLILILCCPAAQAELRLPDNVLERLDKAIAQAPRTSALYEARLDSLKGECRAAAASGDRRRAWTLNLELARGYRSFDTDSALQYGAHAINIARTMGDSEPVVLGLVTQIASLSTAGLFVDASALVDSVAAMPMTAPTRLSYWRSLRLFYGYQRMYAEGQDYFMRLYRGRYLACDDSLLAHLPGSDPFRRFIAAERLVYEGHSSTARKALQKLLTELNETDNLYGMVCYQLAEACGNMHDDTGYARWLAEAAISDIKANVREGMALPTLSMWLYDRGEMDKAFSYVNFALEDATRGNARMSTVSIARLMPVIDEAYRVRISSSRDQLKVYLAMMILLLVVSACLLWVLRGQIAKSRTARQRLEATSRRQEAYMGHFIGLCSNYAERLDSLTSLVGRKLAAGESAELLKMIKAGKFNDDAEDNFSEMFDRAFLDIYPDFVAQVNTLLQPSMQLAAPPEGQLTTELRIYAFVRLGITETQKIAQIMHCSPNTVYSYRNRMRNRALDRKDFDSDVEHLGMVE